MDYYMPTKVARKTSRRTSKGKTAGKKMSKKTGSKKQYKLSGGTKRRVSKKIERSSKRNTKKNTRRSKILRRIQKGGNPDFQQSMKAAASNPALEPEELIRIYTSGENFEKYVVNCPAGITPADIKGQNARNINTTIDKYKAIPAKDPIRMQVIQYLKLTDSNAAHAASNALQFPYIRNILDTRQILATALVKKYGA
jgi:hypothetical protein